MSAKRFMMRLLSLWASGLSYTGDPLRNYKEHASGLSHPRAGKLGVHLPAVIHPCKGGTKAIHFPGLPACHQVKTKLPWQENTLREMQEALGYIGMSADDLQVDQEYTVRKSLVRGNWEGERAPQEAIFCHQHMPQCPGHTSGSGTP